MGATSFLIAKNRAYSELDGAITSGATSLTVKAGEGANFPSTYPFNITIDDEIFKCTNRVTDVLTVVRAQESTSAAAHADGVQVSLNITAKAITDLNTIANRLEDDVPTYVATGDMRYASAAATGAILTVGATDTILSVQGGVPTWRTPANILTDLSGQAGAAFSMNSNKLTSVTDPTNAQDVATKNYVDTTAVLDALFDAHTILMAVTDNTPLALTVAASRIVGRKSTGNISALTAAELLTIIGVEASATADQTGLEIVILLEALASGNRLDHGAGLTGLGDDDHTQYMLNTVANANSMLYSVSADTPAALAVAASRIIGRKASGNISAMTGAETLALLTGANLDVGAYDVRGATITADGLTSGRVVFAGASGVLSDDADFTFATDTLTVTKIAATEFTGAVTGISLSEIENLESDKTFVMTAKTLTWTFTTPSEGIVINVTGAFNDHIFHIHQSTGNPGVATELIHLETEDSDVLPMHIEHTGNNATFEATEFELHRSSPTDGDNIIFGWHFWHDGALTSTEQLEFARIKITAIDVSEDNEDASYTLSMMKAGSMTDIWAITSAGVVSAPALTLPAFTLGGTLTLNGQVFDAGSGDILINSSLSTRGFKAENSSSVSGTYLRLNHTHTTPEAGNNCGAIEFAGFDGAGAPAAVRWGLLLMQYANVTDGAEETVFKILLVDGGVADNIAMTLTGAGLAWFDVGVDVDEYYKVNGTQVVSAQGAAVADPTDPASTQARLTDLLGRLRTHGLIAT